MRRFSANYIFPVNRQPIRNGIVVLDNNNMVVDVVDPKGNEKEYESMEFHNGVIIPGLVNAHCHIELSHLKGRLEPSNGIAGFVTQIRNLRRDDDLLINNSIKQAISILDNNGTVAVGDICNTSDSFIEKQKSNIYFHNFIELFGLNSSEADEKMASALKIFDNVYLNKGSKSLTPHSTYSISDKLWRLINNELEKSSSLVSIHYGESLQEYQILKDRSGQLTENFNTLKFPVKLPNCASPLEVVERFIPKTSKTLFIHNTFSSREEVVELMKHFDEPFFVLCPSSNLFIEGKLPDLQMLNELGANLAIGTDSLASSDNLSVFDQVQILLDKFPAVSFTEAIKWATLNGAKALCIDSVYGSFEIGKSPGLNLITDFDFNLMKPTAKSRVKRLV